MQKHIYTLFLLLGLSFFSQTTFACSCAYVETFCETQTVGADTINAGLIVYGKSIRRENGGVRFEVFQVLHGEPTGQDLFIRSGTGADCGMFLEDFDLDQEFILSLWPSWREGEGQETHYMISICGQNVLEVDGGIVKGKISPGINSIPIEEFHTITECGGLPPVSAGLDVRLGPIPANTELQLKLTLGGPFSGNARLINAMGQEVGRYVIEGEDFLEKPLEVSQFAAGLYFLEVEVAARRKVYKLVIQHP